MLHDLVFGIMLPALLAGVILIGGWPPWRQVRLESSRGLASVPLAMLAALVACFVYKEGWWKLPPSDLWQRVTTLQIWQRSIVLAFAATAIGLCAVSWKRPRWSGWVIGLGLAAVAVMVMRPPGAAEHPLLSRWTLGALVLVLHWCVAPVARRRPGALLPFVATVCFAGASIVLVESRNAKLGLLAASVAAACGCALVLSWLTRQLNFARGGVAFVATMLPGLLVVGAWYDYGDVPTICFVAVALAPVLLWTSELRLARRSKRRATTVPAAIVTVAVGTVIALIMLRHGD